MLFNSLDFALFLPIVFIFYWLLNNRLKYQNILILLASYLFYGWWDWRFLSLIIFSTIVDFSIGLALKKTVDLNKRKYLLWSSLFANLGVLAVFKYFNFFIENVSNAFSFFGADWSMSSLNIILPVGISFYTFQTLSYTIDVYRGNLKPTTNIITFATFVSFFPQLVAGPIERATNLLPQFEIKRKFNYEEATDGLRQILWGLFKKIVIADNCALYANYIFENSETLSGSTQLLGALFFTFQIYGDFSGYSDIAIGTARLFGFNLMQNFAFPYFSRDIAEFWRRWHISLSTWFRDYLYIPLGGSRGGTSMKVRNTFIIFIVSGFWHGASWTFIIWGALNAAYFLPLLLAGKNRQNLDIVAKGRLFPHVREGIKIVATFSLTVLAWIFFRAESTPHAISIIADIFSNSLFSTPYYAGLGMAKSTILLVLLFIIIEWLGRENQYAIQKLVKVKSTGLRWCSYSFLIFIIGVYMFTDRSQFIYFDF
ncbi:D-alanyl-lipoteichoic acid acyltransferase DltB (MBOAT superfamily) [Christiangramia gaetbulicola]|uniref:D-alanyl-lipoteichoic acid acyltransferase DltB (MBOAT superfamily) n=1 Tax=Christiangramia gaetbulicola TaxID=703340 RepID=A0A2T6AFP3_9FLAO|nr:MBOAT family O-acyltransferase [Christiangramia gaetbulicola]PTX42624.1 D-alanyl-lipoteichoic acid acyltransferase DltB (MBOAT superfamily) [Christiangramia gaetbulicola]